MRMMGCMFSTIPNWFGQLRDLQTLDFRVRGAGLKDDGVAILAGLPSLVYLEVFSTEPIDERMHIPGSGMAFRSLKVFDFWSYHNVLLTFERGAMPMLKKLDLMFVPSGCESGGSVECPVDGIEHLPAGLREVKLRISGQRKEVVKSSLKITFEEHHPGAALKIQ